MAGVLAEACFVSVVIWAGLGVAIVRFLGNSSVRIAFNWSRVGFLVIPHTRYSGVAKVVIGFSLVLGERFRVSHGFRRRGCLNEMDSNELNRYRG